MTTTDDDRDVTQGNKDALAAQLHAKRLKDNATMLKRQQMAQKWKEDHKKNNLLFPLNFD